MIVSVNFQTFQAMYMRGKVYVKENEDNWELWTWEGMYYIKCLVEKSEDTTENIMFIDRYFADRHNIIKVISVTEKETEDETPMISNEAMTDQPREQIESTMEVGNIGQPDEVITVQNYDDNLSEGMHEEVVTKHKYIKRTGSPGSYDYTYPGDEKEESTQDKKTEPHTEKPTEQHTADNLPEIDPIEMSKEYGEDPTSKESDLGTEFLAKPENYKKKTFYHYSPNEKITKQDLIKGEAKKYTDATETGLYIGRDPNALEKFYGLETEVAGEKGKIVEFQGEPKFMDVTKPGTLENLKKVAKEKFPESKKPITEYVTSQGFDGIRYFDPWATGEEFVLYNKEPLGD
jgi:hypothetical protein